MKAKDKIYLAGPIRGVPDYKERFAAKRKHYEQCGYIVLDPSVLPECMEQADYMRICMALIQSADAMVLLEGWDLSEGAKIEKAYAEMVGLPVFALKGGDPLE